MSNDYKKLLNKLNDTEVDNETLNEIITSEFYNPNDIIFIDTRNKKSRIFEMNTMENLRDPKVYLWYIIFAYSNDFNLIKNVLNNPNIILDPFNEMYSAVPILSRRKNVDTLMKQYSKRYRLDIDIINSWETHNGKYPMCTFLIAIKNALYDNNHPYFYLVTKVLNLYNEKNDDRSQLYQALKYMDTRMEELDSIKSDLII